MKANPYHIKDIDGGYYNKYPEFAVYEEGKQAGIESEIGHSAELCARYIDDARKEVVEWINERIDWKFALDPQLGGHLSINTRQWQTQLKKWGIEQG